MVEIPIKEGETMERINSSPGEKCDTCGGIKNLPNSHSSYLRRCTCNLAIAGTQPPKY